ncbi:XkdF-like putative serine protease domain-containing protein [Flavobacterium sp.]|uniref:XkdF-like putative serine protease domain-containing protein n=1 Tax=Flavobacterium sp. TaxID=239 RepID=UPI00333F58AB
MDTYVIRFNPNKNKGVYAISLVEDPAIEEYFVQMSKDYEIKLAEIDKEKRLFMTPVLIPDQKILRIDDNGNAFNIVFPKETIQLAQQEFQKRGFQNESTLEHDINLKLEGVTFVESWIKEDEVHDKSVMKGFNQPIGTWFTIFRVDDDDVMAKIEAGEIKGVSIDGAFELEENNINTNMNLETILTAIKEGFASLNQTQVKLGKSMTIDEQAVFFEGEMLAVDTMVFADEAMTEAFADGTYEIDGMMVVVAEGKVAELTEKVEELSEDKKEEEKVEMSDDVEAKVNEIMQAYVGEIAKAVAAQLEGFKAEMKKEEAEVILTKATPIHTEVAEPKNLQEKFLLELQKQN